MASANGQNASGNPVARFQRRALASVQAGSAEDWSKFNPWRAPGSAPVYDPVRHPRAAGGGNKDDSRQQLLGEHTASDSIMTRICWIQFTPRPLG